MNLSDQPLEKAQPLFRPNFDSANFRSLDFPKSKLPASQIFQKI